MSYTVPPAAAAPPPRPRPATVTAASYLLYLLAALQVIYGVIALSTTGPMREAYEQAWADTPELRDSADMIATLTGVFTLIMYLIFAAGFVVLGILDGKGKNPARIVTWVLAGIGVCCFGAGTAGSALGGLFGGISAPGGGTNAPDPTEALSEAMPSWYYTANTAISLVSLLAAVAVIVLLALPPSNEFFRKPQPYGWQPPAYPPIG